ncbi:MAG: hypothetical protein HS108_09535 [Planctomycetes bacterium]|nr:hypothetical protein [Planctomycetota bacterium]MCL4730320.1 hypothetical protein [Planctomycetota bacterium]
MKRALTALLFGCTALAVAACHIGAGFDSAERRRAMAWQEDEATVTPTEVKATETPPKKEDLPPVALQGPPIVYLLVAG